MMHFIYESIILPSIRLSLRFKLFALRDQLRRMVMQGTASDEVFRIQQSSINNAINMLSWADQAMISRACHALCARVSYEDYSCTF